MPPTRTSSTASRASARGRKVGPPRYKSKKDTRQSIRLNTNAFSLQDNGRVYVAKVGSLKVTWSRRLPAAPTSLTVTKDSCGRYFLSFVVDTEPDILPELESEAGIDLSLSDGRKIDSPRFLRRAEKKLKRLQRELSRKARGSKNRAKARIKVARRHAKVANRRRDWHHKASTQIIRDNQAVYVEDLAASGLGRTRLAKSVHDAGWSAFVNGSSYSLGFVGSERHASSLGQAGQPRVAAAVQRGQHAHQLLVVGWTRAISGATSHATSSDVRPSSPCPSWRPARKLLAKVCSTDSQPEQFGRGVSCHRLFRLPGCGHVAVAPVVHALADAGEHRKRVDLFGQEPANICGFLGHRQLPGHGPRQEADGELLSHLTVVVGEDMTGVGVRADDAGDLYVVAGLFAGLADGAVR